MESEIGSDLLVTASPTPGFAITCFSPRYFVSPQSESFTRILRRNILGLRATCLRNFGWLTVVFYSFLIVLARFFSKRRLLIASSPGPWRSTSMPRLWQILGQRQVHLPDLGLDLQQMQSQQHPTKWLILSPGQFWWSHHRREKTPLLHEGEGEEKEGTR